MGESTWLITWLCFFLNTNKRLKRVVPAEDYKELGWGGRRKVTGLFHIGGLGHVQGFVSRAVRISYSCLRLHKEIHG